MATRKALIVKAQGQAEVADVPFPRLEDDRIIVRTKAVALNPTDWKHVHLLPTVGHIVGCDYAGIVEQVGKDVKKFQVGDRVAGMSHGVSSYNDDDGAHTEVVSAKAHVALKIPSHMSFEEASTLGIAITTIGQGLFQALGLPLPPQKVSEKTTVFIYGGSSAMGTMAIQYVKLAGAEVVTTCSPRNFDLCRSFGADQVFDYNAPNVGAEIRKATNDQITLAFDTIAEHSSTQICADAIGSKGGKYSALLPVKEFPRSDVVSGWTLGYTAFGEPFPSFGGGEKMPAKPEDRVFAAKFWEIAQQLLDEKKIRSHPIKVKEGGLEKIPEGLQEMKEGKVSGCKLVYPI